MRTFFIKLSEKLKSIGLTGRKKIVLVVFIAIVILSGISLKAYLQYCKNIDSSMKNLTSISVVAPSKLKQQTIKNSISVLKPFETKLIKTAANKKKSTDNFNQIKEYTENLNSIIKNTTKDLEQLKKYSVPQEVLKYKNNLISEYVNFIAGLNHELKYVNSSTEDSVEMIQAQNNYKNFINVKTANKIELEYLLKNLKNQ